MASQPDHAEETRNYRASLQQEANAPSDPTASSTSSRVALDPVPGPGADNLRALIFLDVDGVLCNSRSQRWYEGPVCDPQDRSLVHPPSCAARPLERRCLGALQALARMTRAEVVVSSWWRTIPAWRDFLLRALSEVGVPVIGETPALQEQTRGEEIAMFLRGAPTVTSFVVLEDEPTNIQSFETHLPEGCWVQTFWDPHCSEVEGLTSVLAEEALEILIHPPVSVQRFLSSI